MNPDKSKYDTFVWKITCNYLQLNFKIMTISQKMVEMPHFIMCTMKLFSIASTS